VVLIRWLLDFLQIDDDTIRFFVYGGTGAIVTGVADNKKKTFWRFIGIAFVGASMASFVTPAIIVYYEISNIKYQMLLGFLLGIGSMILVSKIIVWFKVLNIKSPIKIDGKEGEEDEHI